MKTLQDALFEQSGAAEVAHIDFDVLDEQVKASRPGAELVDRRTAAGVAAELTKTEGNYIASEEDRKKAEKDVNTLTGAHAKVAKVLTKLWAQPNALRRVRGMIDEMEKKLANIKSALDDPRKGAKAALEVKTKIAASRKKLLEDFLEAKPFEGALTNRELLEQQRELQKLIAEVEAIDTSISQPSVGRSSVQPIE